MFQIPNWEDDIPKSNVDFTNSIFPKDNDKKKKTSNTGSPKPQKSPKNLNKKCNTNKLLNKKGQKKPDNVPSFDKRNVIQRKPEQNSKLSNAKKNKKKINLEKKDGFIKTNNIMAQSCFRTPMKSTEKDSRTVVNKNYNNLNKIKLNEKLDRSANVTPQKRKSRKRKHGDDSDNISSVLTQDSNELFPEKPDKIKKKKYNAATTEDEPDFSDNLKDNNNDYNTNIQPVKTKVDKKKEKIKQMLKIESNRNHINVSSNNLRQRMLERLKAAQFRFLNEKLYTTSGTEAQKLFQSDPAAFHTYHQGYQLQVKKWPVNPLDLIVKRLSKMPKTHTIADLGCGEAALSTRVHQKVRSFDLMSTRPEVEACDMAHTPLLSESIDVAVYCLALMGTELTQYLLEANRILKMGGHLLIAEVESRFDKVETFTDEVQRLGFKLKNLDKSHKVFFFMEFTKFRDPPAKKSKLPSLTLKPCLYKKR